MFPNFLIQFKRNPEISEPSHSTRVRSVPAWNIQKSPPNHLNSCFIACSQISMTLVTQWANIRKKVQFREATFFFFSIQILCNKKVGHIEPKSCQKYHSFWFLFTLLPQEMANILHIFGTIWIKNGLLCLIQHVIFQYLLWSSYFCLPSLVKKCILEKKRYYIYFWTFLLKFYVYNFLFLETFSSIFD